MWDVALEYSFDCSLIRMEDNQQSVIACLCGILFYKANGLALLFIVEAEDNCA